MSDYQLSKGQHETPEKGRCAMEWVAYLAGEPHSDAPVCVSPLLRSLGISLNDWLPDDQRQRMRPYLARMIGTADDGLDVQRAFVCADWAVRECVPLVFDLVPELMIEAEALRSLSPICDVASAGAAAEVAKAAGAAAKAARAAGYDRAAARAATRAAKAAAAAGAARAAARATAWAPATAATKAVDEAARAAARAAKAVAYDSIFSPGGLLDRLLPMEVVQIPVVAEWRQVCEIA
jgi:hypothetical protein